MSEQIFGLSPAELQAAAETVKGTWLAAWAAVGGMVFAGLVITTWLHDWLSGR